MSKRWLIGLVAVGAVAVMAVVLLIGRVPPRPPKQPAPAAPAPAPPEKPERPGAAAPEYAAPKTVEEHGSENASFDLSDSLLNLTGQEWTQAGHKGSGDRAITITSSGNSSVRGGAVVGNYPSDWTWSYLKTEAHYNGMAFRVTEAKGGLTFDGQYMRNATVDSYRIIDAPHVLTIKNNYAFDTRDDFVSYPNEDRDTTEDGAINTLNLEDNFVHTMTWLSWRNTGRNDSEDGEFRLHMVGNLIHMKPQPGSGRCSSNPDDGKVAGRPFKMDDNGFTGSRRLFDIRDNIWWIERGSRNHCTNVWPDGTYRNNLIYYSGPPDKQSEYLGELPPGIRVVTGAAGKAAWDQAVTNWVRRHSPSSVTSQAAP